MADDAVTAPDPATPVRVRPDRADLVVGIAAIGAVVVLVLLGRGLTFFADEWTLIADRSLTLPDLLRPFNEHWLALTIVVYHSVLAVFGMHTYVPYLLLLALLHVMVGLLFYVLVRRRTLAPVAAGMTLVVLFLGSGFENLFWGIQIGFVGATALGFGALLLLDDLPTLPGLRRAVAAAALLTLGVMTSGYGLFLLALVGLDLMLDRRRWRWIPLIVIPVVVYLAWYLALGRSGVGTHGSPFTLDRILAVPAFIVDGAAAAIGAASGLDAVRGPWLVVALIAWIGYLALRRRPVPGRSAACLLAIAVQYGIVGLVRSQLGEEAAGLTRYAYLSAMLALMAVAGLIGRPVIPPRRRPWLIGAGAMLLVLSLAWNLQLLVAGRGLYAERAERTRALITVGTAEPLPTGVDPALSLVLIPSPDDLGLLMATYGDPRTDRLGGGIAPVSDTALEDALERARNPPRWLLDMVAGPY